MDRRVGNGGGQRARQQLLAGNARYVEDAAGAGIPKVGNRRLGGVDERHQVQVQDRGPGRLIEAVEGAGDHPADIVDEDVQAAEGIDGIIDELLAAVLAGEINQNAGGLHALRFHFLYGLVEAVLVAGRQRHVAPLIGERACDGMTNSLTGTGDRRVLSFKTQIHSSVLLRSPISFCCPPVRRSAAPRPIAKYPPGKGDHP